LRTTELVLLRSSTKNPWGEPGVLKWLQVESSAQADLGEDALAGEQLGGQADHEAEHGQAAIPGFSERDKAEAGGGVSHGWLRTVASIIKDCEALGVGLTVHLVATGQLSSWTQEAPSGQVAERLAGGLTQLCPD